MIIHSWYAPRLIWRQPFDGEPLAVGEPRCPTPPDHRPDSSLYGLWIVSFDVAIRYPNRVRAHSSSARGAGRNRRLSVPLPSITPFDRTSH